MLRLVELEHELTEPESSLSRPPRRRMIDVTFADAPVDVHWVAFENYYTASVTVLHTNSPPIDPQPRWTCALGQLPVEHRDVLVENQGTGEAEGQVQAQRPKAQHQRNDTMGTPTLKVVTVVRLHFVTGQRCDQDTEGWHKSRCRQ